jgi:hypothetical protein
MGVVEEKGDEGEDRGFMEGAFRRPRPTKNVLAREGKGEGEGKGKGEGGRGKGKEERRVKIKKVPLGTCPK